MIVAAFVPFVLVLLIIAVIFLSIKFAKRSTIIQKVNVKWVFILYCFLLIVSVPISYFLPVRNSANFSVSEEEINKAKRAADYLSTAAFEGKRIDKDKIDGVTILKQWEFPFEGKHLEINREEEEYYYPILILIERKDENDNSIQITQYQSKTIIQHVDLTKQEESSLIDIKEESLTIRNPKQKEIRLAKFSKEFTINQFTTEKDSSNVFLEDSEIYSNPVLYIQIPKDVVVNGNTDEIQFVNE